jgi:hypothetical protein
MKKFFVALLIMMTGVIYSANAVTISIVGFHSITSSSAIVDLRIQNLTIAAFYQADYGPGIDVHLYSTDPVAIQPTLDDTVSVFIPDINDPALLSATLYSVQGKVVGSISAYSAVGQFTTDACSFSPAPTVTPGNVSACESATVTAYPSGALYQWMKYVNSAWTDISGANSQIFSVTSSGQYACEVTYAGCTMITASAASVNIIPSPGVHVTFADTTVCDSAGIKFLLTVDNPAGVTYQWTPSTELDHDNIAQPLCYASDPRTYTVEATNGGCSSTAEVFVMALNKPNTNFASLITGGFMLSGNYPGTIAYVVVDGQTLFPRTGVGQNTTTHAAFDYTGTIEEGQWIYITTVSSECYEEWYFSFLGISSSEELEKNGKTFPNPSVDKFNVVLNDDKECTAVVIDISGNVVLEENVFGGSFSIGESLPAGEYFLQIFSQEGKPIYLTKIIKQ